MTPKQFKDSQEFAFRRTMRFEIRRAKTLTKSQRDVLVALFDLWSHHKAKGVITPKRAVFARKCMVTVRTITNAFAVFRDAGVLVEISRGTGGRGKATAYRVDLHALLTMVGAPLPDTAPGELVRMEQAPTKRRYATRPPLARKPRVAFQKPACFTEFESRETGKFFPPYIEYNNRLRGSWPLPEPVPWDQIGDRRAAA